MRAALYPLAPLALAIVLAGCTVGPDYDGPPQVAPGAAAAGTFARAEDPALTAAPALARWWEQLSDPVLNGLIDDALRENPTLAAARARIAQAQSRLRQQRVAQLPGLSGSASYLRLEVPGDEASGGTLIQAYNLGATASWEADLAGGARRGVEQAIATRGQREAELADAHVTLTAQVAQAYVALRDAQTRLDMARRGIALQEQALALTRARQTAGTASAREVDRRLADLETARADVGGITVQAVTLRDQLAVLTGREPGALDQLLAATGPVPLPPAAVAVGDPAALIARRPDVRAAERALAAATSGIGVAQAKRLPGLSFLGILGLGGPHPADVFEPSNLSMLLAPRLTIPLLDFGRAKAGVELARAQRDEALSAYRSKVLAALEDAEGNLARFGESRQRLASLLAAEQATRHATQLETQRYRAGTASLIDQIDAERRLLAASAAAVQAQARLTLDFVAVNRSLGLGWSESGEAPPAR